MLDGYAIGQAGPVRTEVTELLREWGVELEPMQRSYGDWNEILFGRRSDGPCVIKVCGPDHSGADEVTALRAWDGHGAVRLLESTDDVLLLERLDPDRTLAKVPVSEAIGIVGELVRRLSIPAPAGLPLLSAEARAIAEDPIDADLIPSSWLTQVRQLAVELAREPCDVLVHGDLHGDNVLSGSREPWLAIDPKPVAGAPERGFAEFIWTRADEIDNIPATVRCLADAAKLDLERCRAWTLVRTTSYLNWGVNNGLTEDPVRCRRIIADLI